MEIKTIPEIVLEILSKKSRLTANQIFEESKLPEDKKQQLRLTLVRLEKHISQKIVKDGMKGKQFLYSLKENAIDKEELIDNLVDLMIKTEANSDKYGIDITEKQIEPSIKRLTESGRI